MGLLSSFFYRPIMEYWNCLDYQNLQQRQRLPIQITQLPKQSYPLRIQHLLIPIFQRLKQPLRLSQHQKKIVPVPVSSPTLFSFPTTFPTSNKFSVMVGFETVQPYVIYCFGICPKAPSFLVYQSLTKLDVTNSNWIYVETVTLGHTFTPKSGYWYKIELQNPLAGADGIPEIRYCCSK